MKPEDFKNKITFTNVFDMMNYCYRYNLTYDNSLLVGKTLYFN